MPLYFRMLAILVALIGMTVGTALSQPTVAPPDSSKPWHDDAWTKIIEHNGVHIDYIYYPEADTENDGVVVRLTNVNDGPIGYDFTLIFRAPEAETTAVVKGRLDAGQMKTGDDAGLYWVPFKGENRSIGEIGLRGLEVWAIRQPRPDR